MRKLTLPALAVVAVIALVGASRPPVEEVALGALPKCGNDICMGGGAQASQVQLNGNLILNKPILPGPNQTTVIIDGGVIINGSLTFAGATASSTLKVGILDAGLIYAQGTGPIAKIIPFTTASINFAPGTIVCEDSSAQTATGARVNDSCFLGMPASALSTAGTGLHHTYSCYVSASDAIKVRACAAGTVDDPAATTFAGYVISPAQ